MALHPIEPRALRIQDRRDRLPLGDSRPGTGLVRGGCCATDVDPVP